MKINNIKFKSCSGLNSFEGEYEDGTSILINKEAIDRNSLETVEEVLYSFPSNERLIIKLYCDDCFKRYSKNNAEIEVYDEDSCENIFISKEQFIINCSINELLLQECTISFFISNNEMLGSGVSEFPLTYNEYKEKVE